MTDSRLLTDVSIDSLGLDPSLSRAAGELGFTHCTPIQADTIPRALKGEDVAGQAQTGTGKSAAFLLATMHRLLANAPDPPDHAPQTASQPRALILAPTRELAIQIHKDAEGLGKHSGLKLVVCYGGTGYDTQRQAIADGVDILIGTPGRLIDYWKQKIYTLKAIEVAVLDEADRMFDLGFIDDIRFMFRRMPPPANRLNMLFSATLSHRVMELAYEHMNSPQLIKTDTDTVNVKAIRQKLYHVSREDKLPLFLGLLRRIDPTRTLVFINTKREAEKVEDTLNANGIQAATLSGDVPQKKRERLLDDFKDGKLPVLVATDVAARGLHIPAVSHVFNYDLPQDAEDYVHRIGRTARAGAEGDAISLACETYVYSLPDIEKYMGHKIDSEVAPSDYYAHDIERPAPRPRKPRGGPRRRSGGNGGRGGDRRRSGGGRR
ncbi:DEAD/DEAH box helicase [Salinisphaera sp. P385]|uniref:ATP-dependent RNA helicase RhlB n=1 Tax=Spectribacter acetivorans TaxID=3075603 RepID=A0ABU3B654_9GAMM|nr:DEAD/DEAH box helicase [Salinisphaera sp. P385]MDT0617933.1 DEAD/DEAH box helicase [Salinisphaera sp. P385]